MDWPPQKAKAQGYVCISYDSMAVIKYHGQKQLVEERVYFISYLSGTVWSTVRAGNCTAGTEAETIEKHALLAPFLIIQDHQPTVALSIVNWALLQ